MYVKIEFPNNYYYIACLMLQNVNASPRNVQVIYSFPILVHKLMTLYVMERTGQKRFEKHTGVSSKLK